MENPVQTSTKNPTARTRILVCAALILLLGATVAAAQLKKGGRFRKGAT